MKTPERGKRPPRTQKPASNGPKKKSTSAPKPAQGKKDAKPVVKQTDGDLLRLNQYIARSGVCSRREADELITTGQIKVNGKVVRELGLRVKRSDRVEYEGRALQPERLVYLLLNKPKGFITTLEDEKGRKTVLDLVRSACEERIYPVGRLDRDTTGVLLFTNDGEVAKALTHPSTEVKKIYHVHLNKPLAESDMDKLVEGVALEDGFFRPDVISYIIEAPQANEIGLQIHSGRNRIVRRLFEHVGYKVERLDRSLFANLTKKDVPRGKWRFLKDREVSMLKQLVAKAERTKK